MIRLEHLPADVLELSLVARAAFAGRLAPQLLSLPRCAVDIEPPPDRLDAAQRAELAAALEGRLAALAPHVAVLEAARALARPRACAVVTGQQPGLLCSPLYALYKALQAIRLARQLGERFETPVVALFWNHADDHDVAEANQAHLLNLNLDLQRYGLASLASGRQPLSRTPLADATHRLSPLRAALEQLLAGQPHADAALKCCLPREGETLARASTRALTELLGPLGLVVLEPDWIREPLSRALLQLIAADPARHLEAGTAALRAAGHAPAIEPAEAALLFAHGERGRRALRARGEGFRFDGESGSRSAAELAAEIVQDPQGWSAGALLRPLVQDLALPVAAYVGGLGELHYHAQLGPLRAAAGVPATPFVARRSCTLVEPEVRQALSRLGASVEDVLRARGALSPTAGIAAPPVALKLRALAQQASRDLKALKDELSELDVGLGAQLKRTADQLRALVERLAQKAERVQQNRSGKGRRHERRVNNALFPRGQPQERVLGPLPFVARFGRPWFEQLCAELEPFGSEHLVVHLGLDSAGGDG